MARKPVLDTELVTRLYVEKFQSLKEVYEYLKSHGIINPTTKKPFTRAAIHNAIRRNQNGQKVLSERRKYSDTIKNKQEELKNAL